MQEVTDVKGITIHPITKGKGSLDKFISICRYIENYSGCHVFAENRSGKYFYLSTTEEIINYSKLNKMTIDIPQLYISCSNNMDLLKDTINKIYHKNVMELHVGNIKKEGNRNFVARKVDDGDLNLKDLINMFSSQYITLEILGGVKTFEDQVDLLKIN